MRRDAEDSLTLATAHYDGRWCFDRGVGPTSRSESQYRSILSTLERRCRFSPDRDHDGQGRSIRKSATMTKFPSSSQYQPILLIGQRHGLEDASFDLKIVHFDFKSILLRALDY